MLASQSEAARLKQANDDKMLMAKNEAAGLKAENDAQRAASQADVDRLSREKVALRAQLLFQFNSILQTRDTARGLIVNMSDVLFDTGKYTLKPEAREKLAKVSGILLAYPGLKLQVEGYTDNIGGDAYNQTLSEKRAGSVKDYLESQSVKDANITAMGYGKNDPIADNSTSAGRAQNRRVQLVVSGDAIGVQESNPGAQ